MTNNVNTAGNTETAPSTATVNAEKKDGEKNNAARRKVMVLAVFREAGELKICPIDIEHEDDDQRDLDPVEQVVKKTLNAEYSNCEEQMKRGLGALYAIFVNRLYRTHFRTFENFCFAMLGTHRVGDLTAAKAKARVKKLVAELEDDE